MDAENAKEEHQKSQEKIPSNEVTADNIFYRVRRGSINYNGTESHLILMKSTFLDKDAKMWYQKFKQREFIQ